MTHLWKVFAIAVPFVAIASASLAAQDSRSLLCPSILPWCPQRVPCNFTEVQGSSCLDCNNRLICTPSHGILIKCWVPGKNHCVEGECASEPSQECAGTTESTESTEGSTPVEVTTEVTTQEISTEATSTSTEAVSTTTEAS